MPQASNMILNDGQTTPVAHTFNYVPYPNGISAFEDRAGGIMVGYNKITMGMTRPRPNVSAKTVANRFVNITLKVDRPTLESLGTADSGFTPPPTKAYSNLCEIRFSFPERSTLAERKDVLAYAKNLLANAFTTALVENYETPY